VLACASGPVFAAALLPALANAQTAPALAEHKQFLTHYCQGCHNDRAKTGGMSVQPLDANNLAANDETWEKILHKLSLGEMPPAVAVKPPKELRAEFTSWLSASLDRIAAQHPDPGLTVLRRLNRAEYANALRDLLDLKIDVSNELPADDSGHGFDNIAEVLTVSPTLMNSYIRVAGKVSRIAAGVGSRTPVTTDFRLVQDAYANSRASDDLPLDSRGGGVFSYYAPYDATYRITVDINQAAGVETRFLPENRIVLSLPLKAGLHAVGASFRRSLTLDDSLLPLTAVTLRGPRRAVPPPDVALDIQVDGAVVKRQMAAADAPGVVETGELSPQVVYARDVQTISVQGPFDPKSPGATPSRRKIFTCHPSASLSEEACARSILSRIAHQAYRRPVSDADLAPLMTMYAEGRKGSDFEHGVEAALEMVLVSPNFLFIRESDPPGAAPGSVHRLSDVELATRLSLFLWSSIPDPQLLAVAEKKQLSRPEVLKGQVARMLADPKAQALTDNFAGQWLYLRRLEFQSPDRLTFPEFDTRLRAAMLTETDMFFDAVLRGNRPVTDFIASDYTFLNQRLAEHYAIPGVRGASFRKVTLDPASHRGGLLGQGSILTVTSYNDRTSVVLRGKWILENLFAAPPPPPPPNVPSLDVVPNAKNMTVREQMELHRKNPVCASCHTKMDPLGFALENFDAVGAWRQQMLGRPIQVDAVLPDGTKFEGPAGLREVLMDRKDEFVKAFTQRLMIYALGRGVDGTDMPAVRAVAAAAAKDGYRTQSIIMGIVQSVPFTMRRTLQNDDHT
jgi:hypothetical protein